MFYKITPDRSLLHMTLSHLKPQLPSNPAGTLMGKGCLVTTSFWAIRALDYGVFKNCIRYGSFFLIKGDHCDQHFDYCANSPCGFNRTCTNLDFAVLEQQYMSHISNNSASGSFTGYTCSACPTGYELFDEHCEGDISHSKPIKINWHSYMHF